MLASSSSSSMDFNFHFFYFQLEIFDDFQQIVSLQLEAIIILRVQDFRILPLNCNISCKFPSAWTVIPPAFTQIRLSYFQAE
jgi:hypothetical protein